MKQVKTQQNNRYTDRPPFARASWPALHFPSLQWRILGPVLDSFGVKKILYRALLNDKIKWL